MNTKTNVSHLNARIHARTAAGTGIYVQYKGTLKLDDALLKMFTWSLDAKTTKFGDHEWFTTPIFETDDESLQWIEDQTWVGQGRAVIENGETAVEYGIYQVTN